MLGAIFRENKWRILSSYALLLFEFLLYALQPFLLGKALDALLCDDYGTFFLYLGFSLLCICTSSVRRWISNRIFLTIWGNRASRVIIDMVTKGTDTTKVVSRAYMVKDYAHFLESIVPNAAQGVIESFIAVYMLCMFIPRVAPFVFVSAILSSVSGYVWSNWLMHAETLRQVAGELANHATVSKDIDGIVAGYEEQRRCYVGLADLDMQSWRNSAVLLLISEGITLAGLVTAGCQLGMILAGLTYTRKLHEKTDVIVMVFRRLQQLGVYGRFLKGDDG